MRAFKQWQRRGGVRGNMGRLPGGRRYGEQAGIYVYFFGLHRFIKYYNKILK